MDRFYLKGDSQERTIDFNHFLIVAEKDGDEANEEWLERLGVQILRVEDVSSQVTPGEREVLSNYNPF
jgi:hypothetical protein